jgi:hypothetical protein
VFFKIAISRSARQGCPAAPILYIIQAEPMACAIRNTPEIHGIKQDFLVKDERNKTQVNVLKFGAVFFIIDDFFSIMPYINAP